MDSFDWIREYELKPYHEVDTESIQCFSLYINEKRELINISSKIHKLETRNCITKKEWLDLALENSEKNNRKYDMKEVYIFNVNLQFEDVNNFVTGSEHASMMKKRKEKSEYQKLFPSIEMFQDLNSVFLIYFPRKLKQNNTKKVYLHPPSRSRSRKQKRKGLKVNLATT